MPQYRLTWLYFGTPLLVSFGVGATGAASNLTPDSDKIQLNGCPIQLAPNRLMMLDQRGTPYDITTAPLRSDPRGSGSAPPSPARKLAVSLDGIVAEGEAGSCKRGIKLKEIQWHYTRASCPANRPAKTKK